MATSYIVSPVVKARYLGNRSVITTMDILKTKLLDAVQGTTGAEVIPVSFQTGFTNSVFSDWTTYNGKIEIASYWNSDWIFACTMTDGANIIRIEYWNGQWYFERDDLVYMENYNAGESGTECQPETSTQVVVDVYRGGYKVQAVTGIFVDYPDVMTVKSWYLDHAAKKVYLTVYNNGGAAVKGFAVRCAYHGYYSFTS